MWRKKRQVCQCWAHFSKKYFKTKSINIGLSTTVCNITVWIFHCIALASFLNTPVFDGSNASDTLVDPKYVSF